jgi:thermostable 8-oxoguanine DNA glycosylase
MSFYSQCLAESLQKRIAYFNSAGLSKEAELLQARLSSFSEKSVEKQEIFVEQKISAENPVLENSRSNLKEKISSKKHRIPELEKQYILENLEKAKTLKELEPLRTAYISRMLKISRANHSEKIPQPVVEIETNTGPYNNEKIFCEALQLIYSQDPLWIEDLKELYFSIMPLSSATAVSKSPL